MDLSSRCPNSIFRALTRIFGTWFYRPLIFAALNHWSWELDVENMDSGQYQPRGFHNLIRATSFWPHLRCQGAKYRNVWNKETKEFRCKWTGWQLGRAKSFGGVQIGKFSGDSNRQAKFCKFGVFCPANYAPTHLRGLIVLGTLKGKFQGSAGLSILSPTKSWSTLIFFSIFFSFLLLYYSCRQERGFVEVCDVNALLLRHFYSIRYNTWDLPQFVVFHSNQLWTCPPAAESGNATFLSWDVFFIKKIKKLKKNSYE